MRAGLRQVGQQRLITDPILILFSSLSTSPVPTPVDTEGYMIPNSTQLALTAPPPDHSSKSVHSSTVSSNTTSATESTPSCLLGVNHAHNPLYYTSNAGPVEGGEGNEGLSRSFTSQDRDFSHLTPDTNILLKTASDGSQPRSPGTNSTHLSQQTSSPLSPTGQ